MLKGCNIRKILSTIVLEAAGAPSLHPGTPWVSSLKKKFYSPIIFINLFTVFKALLVVEGVAVEGGSRAEHTTTMPILISCAHTKVTISVIMARTVRAFCYLGLK